MGYYEVVKILWDQVLLYLRKSRSDDPNQTVEEVLAKHEAQLQEYAERELGGRIPEENIYREVVSGGESLAEREAIMALLARCEDPNIKGVLVIEPQRLSRGSLTDCDTLMTTFELTGTFVVTPMMTYDLSRKMERKFFQDELMRGRDYLDYTKEILMRGRLAAVKRGCYIAQFPPFGYNKVVINGDHTLEINEAEAEIVRMMFDWYVQEHLTPYQIAQRLNDMGIPSARGKTWLRDAVRKMLRNEHYTGKVVYNRLKDTPVLENGVVTVKKLQQAPEDVIIAPGKHKAIISPEVWDAARVLVARNPPKKHIHELKNIYSGVLRCSKCGGAMCRATPAGAEPRFECRKDPRCYKSIRESRLTTAIIDALELSELPALQLKVKNKDGDAAKIQQRLVKKLEKQLAEYKDQEESQYELLENRTYTPEIFAKRNAALRAKMEDCEASLKKARASLPKSVDYEERVTSLQFALAMLKDPTATPTEKNRALKAIVEKIEYTSVPPRSGRSKKDQEYPYTLAITLRL